MFVNKSTTPIDLAWSHWSKYETARCQNLCGLLSDLKVGASSLPRGETKKQTKKETPRGDRGASAFNSLRELYNCWQRAV